MGLDSTNGGLTPRKKGIRFGAKLLFAGIAIFPLVVAFCVAFDNPGPLLLSFLPFFAGICRMLYARMFEEGVQRPTVVTPALGLPPPHGAALPPYQPPVSVVPPSRTTGELVEPPSVTEHTTRLLDK